MMLRSGTCAATALLVLTAGCRYLRPIPETPPDAEERNEQTAAAVQDATQPAAARPASVSAPLPERIGGLRDRNIAAMLLASNNTNISYARLVPTRAQRDEVKQFADRMLNDHVGVNAQLTQLLASIELAPEENLASLDLRDESAGQRAAMRDLSGFAFDSAYITNEVSFHQRFLGLIDNVMLPAARHGELRTLLTTLRPAVAAHLAHAEQVWANVMAQR